MTDPQEPNITINGYSLTRAQAMTLRVACEAFDEHLALERRPLGDDEHGEQMAKGYRARIAEIRALMYPLPSSS